MTADLQPEGFAEIPPALARELGIENLDWVVISTARGAIETRALITERLRPFQIDGRTIYQVGMLLALRLGGGYATGDIAAERLGAPCRRELRRINSILSSIFGMEFPAEGLQWQRVCDSREALRCLIREVESEQAALPAS